MGDMADFIGWGCPDYYEDKNNAMERIEYLFPKNNELIDVYLALKPIIKYVDLGLADSIVEYYQKYNKLSEKQKTVLLICLSDYEDDCVLYKKFLCFYNHVKPKLIGE